MKKNIQMDKNIEIINSHIHKLKVSASITLFFFFHLN